MKFKCLREDILSAIQKAEKAVAVNSTLPVMEGLLLETVGNTVCITGNDLEIAIEASFEAEITETGKIVLNARMFAECLQTMWIYTCKKSEKMVWSHIEKVFPKENIHEHKNNCDFQWTAASAAGLLS